MNVNQRVTVCSNVPTLRAATPVHAKSISHKILTTGKIARVTSFFYSITEENKVVLRAAFRKYRPTVGTSSKLDFAHIWLIDSP